MNICEYIKVLESNFQGGVLVKENSKSNIPDFVPSQLVELYKHFDSLELPFGEIFSVENAQEMSGQEPFKSNGWFCFGKDNYFSYLLCKKDINENEDCFSTWDYETDFNEVEPCFSDLNELLDFIIDDYEGSEDDMCKVIVEATDKQFLSELLKVKKIFASPLSIMEIKNALTNGKCVIKNNFDFYDAKKILSENKFEHIKIKLNQL